MLVGGFSDVSYRGFLLRQAPIALVGLVCVFASVWLVYRHELPRLFAASCRAAVLFFATSARRRP